MQQLEKSLKPIVALYLRVSTSPQDFEMQLQDLKTVAEKMEATIYHEYTDTVGGSTQVSERQYASDVIEDARQGRFQTLLVWRIDRIARDEEFGLNYLRRIEETGCRIKFMTNAGIDTPMPYTEQAASMIKSMRVLLLMNARAELESIRARTRASKTHWIKSNKWPSVGHVPYGYKVRSDYGLEIVSDQAEIVKRIFGMYLHENLTIRKIAEVLNKEKIPSGTPNGWKKDRIQAMLHNPVYVGALPINGKKLGPIHTFYCDPIVGQESFDKIINKTIERSARSKRNANRDYLFAGLLRCAICGYPLRSMKNGSDNSYSYGFTRRPSDGKVLKDKRCSGRGCGKVSQRNLVEAIYKDAVSFWANATVDELEKWFGGKYLKDTKDPKEEIEDKIKRAQSELNLLQKRLEIAIEMVLDDKFSLAKEKCKKVISELGPKIESKNGLIHSLKQSILTKVEEKKIASSSRRLAELMKIFYHQNNRFFRSPEKSSYREKELTVLASVCQFTDVIYVNFPDQYLQIHMSENYIDGDPRIVSLLEKNERGGDNDRGGHGPKLGRPRKDSIVSASVSSSNLILGVGSLAPQSGAIRELNQRSAEPRIFD